jgi:predicted transposase YbfD/YdcC
MLARNQQAFIELFSELDYARCDEQISYPLNEILFLLVAAVLSGAESWRAIVSYGEEKLDVLRQFFPYSFGIPSSTTIIRVLNLLDKARFESWLTNWSKGLILDFNKEHIVIDGKAIKGARRHAPDAPPVFLLNAFATKNGLVLSQKTIGCKENEITAIPEMLDTLSVKGSTISIDAIGCQKKIAKKILAKEADYFLAVKNNQKKLYSELKNIFKNKDEPEFEYYESNSTGHGRKELRRCWSTSDLDWFKITNRGWDGVKSICMVECKRTCKNKTSIEQKFYITSTDCSAKQHLFYSRNHWAIENNLHWVLDVVLKEDSSQVRLDNAAENMGVVRKVVLNLIKKYKKQYQDSTGIPTLRLKAGWDNSTATKILSQLGS